MIECPKCFSQFNGKKCSCGYTPPRIAYFHPPEAKSESVSTEHARQWLDRNGIHKPGMSREEKTKSCLAYMRKLKTSPKPEPTAWAFEIISRIADGEIVSAHAEAIAREVSGVKKEQRGVA